MAVTRCGGRVVTPPRHIACIELVEPLTDHLEGALPPDEPATIALSASVVQTLSVQAQDTTLLTAFRNHFARAGVLPAGRPR